MRLTLSAMETGARESLRKGLVESLHTMVSDTVYPDFNFQELLATQSQTVHDNRPQLQLIAGDASDRKFYRLEMGTRSAICMKFPVWEGGYGGDPLSWLGMQHALVAMGIPVPKILHVDEANCCIWTEDFGDQFLNYNLGQIDLDLKNTACTETLEYYKQALKLLLQAQYPPSAAIEHPALYRAFDTEKLMFEMNFFLKHFVRGWLGMEFRDTNPQDVALQKELTQLCMWLSNRERVLCHRDYHVRNVMVVDNNAKWIDFQDARMGPHTYDVVSLVRDSYVRLTSETRHFLYKFYFENLNQARAANQLPTWSWETFFTETQHMGLQRNIKALGSFGYLAIEKQKSTYLQYVPHTLEVLIQSDSLMGMGEDLQNAYPVLLGFLHSLSKGKLRPLLEKRLKESGARHFL